MSKENRPVLRTRRRQQPAETRAQIQQAAVEFLRERPFHELSVNALMSQTGHTRSVFYRHFEDIPALVVSLIADLGAELVEVGDLRALEALGTRHLAVGVTWTPAGEGTYRAVLATADPRTVPSFMVVGGADTAATVAHCVDRVLAVEGVRWGGIVTPRGT